MCGCRNLCGEFLMVCLWWSASLSAHRWDLTVLDLLVWKSKEGSFTSLIGSLALHWTAFTYVWDSYLAKYNFVLSVQFHVSFWPAQKCSFMIFTFRCNWTSVPFFSCLPLLMDVFVIYRSESESSRSVRYVLPKYPYTLPLSCLYICYSPAFFPSALLSVTSHPAKPHQLSLHPSGLLLLCTLTRQFHPVQIRLLFSSRKQWDLTVLPAVSPLWFSSLLDRFFLQGCQPWSSILFWGHNTLALHNHGYISPPLSLYDLDYERQAW